MEKVRMAGSSRWLGVGVFVAGVSLQVLVGSTAAWADSGIPSDSGQSVSGAEPKAADTPGAEDSGDTKTVDMEVDSENQPTENTPRPESAPKPETTTGEQQPEDAQGASAGAHEVSADDPAVEDDPPAGTRDGSVPQTLRETPAEHAVTDDQSAVEAPAATDDPIDLTAAPEPAADSRVASAQSLVESATVSVGDAKDAVVQESSDTVTGEPTGAGALIMSEAAATATATGTDTSVIGTIFGVLFSMITALEQWAAGPATAPAGSTVTVRSSSLQLTDSLSVPADWYFPEATEPGQAPERIVFFAHGFMAIGAMYSYTAARLAESTNSIVVVPTVTSNFFAADGLWINGPALQPVVAALFTGSRAALTGSALAAGYAGQYGLAAAAAELPRAFALAGHSAGGSLVTGAAGYLVDNGAAADLAGVVLFDGVTTGSTVADALAKLDSTGRFIPVREIGAPWNLWNAPSAVNGSLSTARPDHFTGVVLSGGTHADTIQGGSLLIQLALWILVGVPQGQNVLAMQDLADTWLNQWFDGQTGIDDNLVPGSTITIGTPVGPATATVIGTPGAAIAANREDEIALAA